MAKSQWYNFLSSSSLEVSCRKDETYLLKSGEKMALNTYRLMRESVPAYKKYLSNNKFKKLITSIDQFQLLPFTSKEGYLRPSKYEELFVNNRVDGATTVSATSGTSGEPFYVPRGAAHDDLYEQQLEILLNNQFAIKQKSTLVVLGFGLGIWIGGLFTYRALERISERGYRLSVVPAGTHKEHFLKAVKGLSEYYDQIILMGYPPFIKDVLDEGASYGIDWKKYQIKIVTAAEGYSEKFRSHLATVANIKNPVTDIVNIYGTVELGTMAHETTVSNVVRQLSLQNKSLFKELYPYATSEPTLAQYYPQLVYFEQAVIDGKQELLGTGYCTSIPLVRYRFHDLGGVWSFTEVEKTLQKFGLDIYQELKKHGVSRQKIVRLPFVYVQGRSNASVSLYGIVLSPEIIRDVFYSSSVKSQLTGLFSMCIRYDRLKNQYLEVNVELSKNIKDSRKLRIAVSEKIVNSLLSHSTEYNHLYNSSPTYRRRLVPKIVFWQHGDQRYFNRRGKQAWVV